MAIKVTQTNTIGVNYVPKANINVGNQFPSLGCVSAHDRFILKAMTFTHPGAGSDIVPDDDGYMPHLAYYPGYDRDADPAAGARAADEMPAYAPRDAREAAEHDGYVFGNDIPVPVIRVDLGSLFCRWAGNVQIEGGSGPGSPDGDLTITWIWDRPWAQGRVRRPTDPPGFVLHTFTVWGTAGGAAVTRPAMAETVWSPSGIALDLDNGPGTFGQRVTAAVPYPLGPFTRIRPAAAADALVFGIRI